LIRIAGLAGIAATAIAVLGVASPSAYASTCTRYADPHGRDSSRGTRSDPFRTAQRLADSLRPGQTGCLRRGTYDDTDDGYVLRIDHGGEAGKPIMIRSFPGERARLVGTTSVVNGSNYVRLVRLVLRGTGGGNSVKIYARRVTIRASTITNAGLGESCLILGNTSGGGRARNVLVKENRFHDCGSLAHDNHDHAIYVANSSGARIVGNLFWSTAAYTIHLYPNARETVVAHNVIDGGGRSVRGGVLFGGDSQYASRGNVVKYNIIAYSQTANIASGWGGAVGTGNVARNNCLWAGVEGEIDRSDGGFTARSNVTARPRFVNRKEHDYRLRPGSGCRSVVGYDAAARLG